MCIQAVMRYLTSVVVVSSDVPWLDVCSATNLLSNLGEQQKIVQLLTVLVDNFGVKSDDF